MPQRPRPAPPRKPAAPRTARRRAAQRRRRLAWAGLLAAVIVTGLLLLPPVGDQVERQIYPQTYRSSVEKYSRRYGVEPELVYAVAKVESNFVADAHSEADANGVMQMTEPAFEWVQYRMELDGEEHDESYTQITDPDVSIRYGTYMLSLLEEQLDGDEALMICAYHAGLSNVRAWLENPEYSADGITLDQVPYSDTAWYLDEVQKAKAAYKRLY